MSRTLNDVKAINGVVLYHNYIHSIYVDMYLCCAHNAGYMLNPSFSGNRQRAIGVYGVIVKQMNHLGP